MTDKLSCGAHAANRLDSGVLEIAFRLMPEYVAIDVSLHIRAIEDENMHLRAALATSEDPCIYCQLPAEKMAYCRAGFPGCARMDDLTGCPEFGAMMQLEDVTAQRDALQAFKDFVHRRLDEAGVPTHPDGPHSKEGCRIGDRLDIVLAALEQGNVRLYCEDEIKRRTTP